MPTYLYEREDGSRFEEVHGMNDKLEKCPTTGQKVKRILNWEGNTIITGWSPDKERKKAEWRKKNPFGTTLPHYQKKIDENTQKALELEEKNKKNITEV